MFTCRFIMCALVNGSSENLRVALSFPDPLAGHHQLSAPGPEHEGQLADVDSEAELAGVVASGGRCVFVAGAVVAAPFHKHTIKMGAFVAGELTRISDFTSHPSLITVSVVMLTAEFMSLGFDLKFLMTGLMKAQSARQEACLMRCEGLSAATGQLGWLNPGGLQR